MASNTKTEQKTNKVLTPKFRVSFPALFEARLNQLSKKNEFGVMMLFPKGTDLTDLKKLAQKVAIDKWGKKMPKKLRSPFRDGNEKYEESGREEYKDCIYINAKSQYKPGVVGPDVQPLIDPGEVYGGCWGRATVTAYAYDTMGNQGVSFSLQNFQKLADDSPFGGARSKAEDDFSEFGGGVAQEADIFAPEEDDDEVVEEENDAELFG